MMQMKKAAFLLLFATSGFQVYSQEPYIAPYIRKRMDSTYKHFSTTDKKISGFQLALETGVFAPQGNLSVLGSHTCLGGSVGWRFNRFMLDLSLIARLTNNTPRNYTVDFNDTLYQTNSYSGGGYWGLGLEYELFKKGKHEWDILAGAGVDFFECKFIGGADTTNTIVFNSVNLNFGLGYRLFLRHIRKAVYPYAYYPRHSNRRIITDMTCAERYSYLAFQVKYNVLNFANPGGSDFSGNAITVGVVYGLYRDPR